MTKTPSSFSSNVLKLLAGNVFAQGLGILAIPFVTRLFDPVEFGIAALFMSVMAIVSPLACLRYELAIILPKDDDEAANLLGISICCAFFISAFIGICAYLFGAVVSALFNAPKLNKYLWVLPFAVFINGCALAFNYWCMRSKRFERLSIAQVITSAIAHPTKLIAGFAGYISGGVLIGSTVLGRIISTIELGYLIWRDDWQLFKKSISWKGIRSGVIRYKRFGIFSTWANLFNNMSVYMISWILAFFFSPVEAGYFELARYAACMPLNLIGSAIAQVFYQKATETKNSSDNLPIIVEELFKRLVSIVMLPALLFMLIGKDISIIFFGQRWAEAGVYIQILSPWLILVLISNSINQLYNVTERQKAFLVLNIILLLTRTITLIGGCLIGNPRIALSLFTIISLLIIGGSYFWILSRIGVPKRNLLYYLGKYAGLCLPILTIIYFLKFTVDIDKLIIFCISFLGSFLYYLIVFKNDKYLKEQARNLFQELRLIKTNSGNSISPQKMH